MEKKSNSSEGSSMRILVMVAHPDDEILGVGGTVCKHIENNDEVFICIVTKTYEPNWSDEYRITKIEEQKKVDGILKISKRFNLGLHTVKLNTYPHGEFNNKIRNIVNEINPDILYTHYENDLNYDHGLIFKACLVATRPPNRTKLYCFETLSETEWNVYPFQPNYWVEINNYIEKKIKAFQIYESEIKEAPHPRSAEGIRILAKKRGSEICVDYAEAFKKIRDYWL